MTHWRKSHPPAPQRSMSASWAVGASVILAALVLMVRHLPV
jgi:hypothetical protein